MSLVICFGLAVSAQDTAAAQSPNDRADAILREAMADRKIPGLQAVVLSGGQIVFSKSYGVANLQTPIPVTSQTVFTLNSITKAFTGVAVMQEVDKGRLDLSAPISDYLTDIPASWGKVTVQQLLGQISGLPDLMEHEKDSFTIGLLHEDEAWIWALTQPLPSAPGVAEHYNQTNLALIQRIVNKLNNRPPDASIVDAEIATAGMKHTTFGDSRDIVANRVQPYYFVYPGLGQPGVLKIQTEFFGPMLHAGSGLNSTAEDVALWVESILDNTQLTEQSRKTLWTAVRLNDGTPSPFGIGWGVSHAGNYDVVGMNGGARSAFSIYPKQHIAVIILTNLLGALPEELTDEIAACFAADMHLSVVTSLRETAEQSQFKDIDAQLAVAEKRHSVQTSDEEEFEEWVSSLLFRGQPDRAMIVAEHLRRMFPKSAKALATEASAYIANGRTTDAESTYRELLDRDPGNRAAKAYLHKQ
jgi:CubicO group peptidase (beta-lactamase class C family)